MKMWKRTNPSSWFLAGMVWFINNICLTVCLVTCVTCVNIQFSTWRHDGPCWLLQNEQLNVGHIFPAQAACEMFHATFIDISLSDIMWYANAMELHWIGIANAIELILWSSGKGQARMGKGWPLRRKALKLKPLPRAYIKVVCHHPPRLTIGYPNATVVHIRVTFDIRSP